MLGYVFWHWPTLSVLPEAYEDRLYAFHHALRLDPPPGFLESACLRISGASWLPQARYEDWYEVADFGALGELNEAAVSGTRKAPHHAVAALAAGGSGGLYRLIAGESPSRDYRISTWFSKPPGMSYDALRVEVEMRVEQTPVSLWQRQLVLGPAPEFCLQSSKRFDFPQDFKAEEVAVVPCID